MKFVHPPRIDIGNRFSKPAKETLVSWINEKNNRGFYAHQFTFSDPIKLDDDGTVEIPFEYTSTGEESSLIVQRINIGLIPGFKRLVTYPKVFSSEGILDSLYQEYGLYLDSEMVEVEFDPVDVSRVLSGETLDGFDNGGDGAGLTHLRSDQMSCTIRIKDNHLVYEGTIRVFFAETVLTNTDTIARRLDLRQFYSQNETDKPYIETYQPRGLWMVTEKDREARREIESRLYHLTRSKDKIVDYELLAELLTRITKTMWSTEKKAGPFNVMNSRVLYNDLSSGNPGIAPVSYSHLLIIELSDYCTNLQGRVHIAYKYSTPSHPAAYPGGYNYLR